MLCSATCCVGGAMPWRTEQQKVLEALCKLKALVSTLKFQNPKKKI